MDTTLFHLSHDVLHLNHGSFGACPKPIFEDYQRWQMEFERNPVDFSVNEGMKMLDESTAALAAFIGCARKDLVMTTNPSYAFNIIAKSLPLSPGDEILSTNHEYGAMERTWKYYCGKAGAHFVQQDIQLPLTSSAAFEEQFWAGLTPNTKAIFISHCTSMTALIFPVEAICKRAKELGLITIVDGAHVPGHIPLNLGTLQADIYTGACHKWLLTPKGSSFLYVKSELQALFDPLIISWGYEAEIPGPSQFLDYHQWQGTRDYSAFLTIPAALKFRKEYQWEMVSEQSKQRIREHYADLCSIAGTEPICSISSEFLGQMCSIPVNIEDPTVLKKILFEDFRIEIPVFRWNSITFVRLSTNGYVTDEDIAALKDALRQLKTAGTI